MSMSRRGNPRVIKDALITTRVPRTVKELAAEMAFESGQSLATFMEALIRAEASRQGKIIKVQPKPQEVKRQDIPHAYGT